MKPRSVQTANGQHERQVGEDHAGQRVRQVVAGEDDVERDDQPYLRQHQDADHQDDEELAAAEAVLGERDGCEEGEQDRGGDGDDHDDDAVLDVVPEVRPVHRVPVVRQGGMEREPGRGEAVDLVVRLERRRDHPEDREDEDHEHEHAEDVPADGGGAGDGAPMRAARRARSLRVSQLHHPAHVGDAHRGDHHEHQQRDSGAAAEVRVRVALDVDVDAHQVVRGVHVRGADQEVRLREDAEVPDDREARQDQEDGLQDRERDVAEDPQRAGAVDLGGLDELARDLREARVDVIVTNGSAPQTISSVTIASFEKVVAYQSCWK